MSVSVIIPVFKVERYIKRCLTSVIEQDYQKLEIIVVDDCSPDNSINLAKETLSNSNANWKIVTHKHNKGLSGARNTGIRAASGNYLFFLDSDDELTTKTCISSLVEIIESTGADFVSGNYQRIYNDHIYVSRRYCNEVIIKGNSNIIQAFAKGDIPIIACNKLIKSQFIEEKELYFKEGIINEDELWTFNTIIHAHCIALSGKTTYNYYMNEGSIMSGTTLSRLHSAIEVYKELATSLYNNFKGEKHLSAHINRFAFFRHLNIMSLNETNKTKLYLYNTLRKYQKDIDTPKDTKWKIIHLHLFVPAFIGFRIMKFVAILYNFKKNRH